MFQRNAKQSKNERILFFLVIILPIAFSWLFIASFVLIYSFDQIAYIENNGIIPGINLISFILIIGIPVGISILLTGITIDKYPEQIGKLTTLGLFGSSASLALDLFALRLLNALLVVTAAGLLGFFMGILVVSSHALYGSAINWNYRGRYYAFAILIFELCSLLFIFITKFLELDFFFPLSFYALLGLILCIIFYNYTRNWPFWTNDPFPTRFHQIITRPSVNAYFLTHTLIYIMIGLMIGSLAEIGTFLELDSFLIELGAYKSFWASLMLGATIFILPAGFFTDKWGRRKSIILAAYGIVFASIIIGLLQNSISFSVSAFIIGISFALIHPSLDSSLWVDLASKDSIGRYFSLGFLSLSLGVVIGMTISTIGLFDSIFNMLIFNVFFLIALAVLASFPLFWTSDSSPPLFFFLLLVINDAGMPIFHYEFGRTENLKVDLPLISGALSAVGSFMLEATGEKGARLNLVRHGTHFILSDKKEELGLSGAIFANKNDPELQILLNKFLTRFQEKYKDIIPSWKGDLSKFKDAVNDAEEIFGPLVTIQVD
ncbi:MAG: hypothetical protein ACXADY_17235 [Candidatus Hodarchaeales archaeon]